MILGLSFALVCALGTNLSALFKARGAVLARPIRVRHPLRSAADLFRQRWFAVGWILALFAWGLHIEALALAPLSTRAGSPVRRPRVPRRPRRAILRISPRKTSMGRRDAHRRRTCGNRPDRDRRGPATLVPGRADRRRDRDPGARGRAGEDLDPPRRRAPRRGAPTGHRCRRAVRGLRRRDQVPHPRDTDRSSACSAHGRSPR